MEKKAEMILLSDCIFTAADPSPFSGYVALNDGRVLAVGRGKPDAGLVDTQTRFLDLGDRTVMPGFIDVHCFFTGYSVGFIGADLSGCRTRETLLERVKAYAAGLPEKKSILCHGWDPAAVPSDDATLEDIFGGRPVILFASGCETCWMNRAARERYRFTPETCYPEAYVRLLPDILGDRDFIVPEFRKYMNMMNSRGVTSVKEMGYDRFCGFTDVLAQLERENELTLRVNFMSQPVAEPIDLAYGRAMREKFQGEFVHFSGFNQMTDGSVSQLCADLKQPYNCADTCCAQDIDWDKLGRETRSADAEGFRFSLHAQGDAAISKALDIYETCLRDESGRVVNRHAITDLEFSDPVDLKRMGNMGVIAEIYPQIQSIANRKSKLAMISEKIGLDRGRYYWNRRKMADSGVPISCGTDLPLLIDNIPESVYYAVGGYFPEGGEPFNKQNTLTLSELLTAWTRGGAYDLGFEDILGTLEPGKKADIAVLSGNIFTTSVENSRSLKVDLTLVGGRIVHSAL